jgi:hypothetical protein
LAREGTFGHDEAGGGSLAIVLDEQVVRDPGFTRTQAGEGRHDDAVGEGKGPEADGREELHSISF